MSNTPLDRVFVDIDRDRIRTILLETYRTTRDVLGIEIEIAEEEFVRQVEPYLESNRISLPVFLGLPNQKYPGLQIEVNLRRAKVFARIPSHRRVHPKQAFLNRYLKVL